MPRKSPKPLSRQIRDAIDESGFTRYRISKETGLNQSALSKFYHGQRTLSMESVDKLAEFLGLRIVMDRPTRNRKAK